MCMYICLYTSTVKWEKHKTTIVTFFKTLNVFFYHKLIEKQNNNLVLQLNTSKLFKNPSIFNTVHTFKIPCSFRSFKFHNLLVQTSKLWHLVFTIAVFIPCQ